METKTKKESITSVNPQIADFFGKLYSFNTSLKLYHWHVTGKASYAQHIALDQALEVLPDALDRIVETSYAYYGDLGIKVPETNVPADIIAYVSDFYKYVESQRELFSEDFSLSIIDDIHEAMQQLLYRLKRLQ